MTGARLNELAQRGTRSTNMNDDAFARLVAEEVKNNVSDAQKNYLLLPENWTRHQRALTALTENLADQLSRLNRDKIVEIQRYEALGDDGFKLVAEASADYDNKAKKISRFKFHVDSRLDEVSRVIAMGIDHVDEKIKFVEFLRTAISTHKSMLEEYDLEATSVDLALWDALDGVWSFDKIDPESLA